MIKNIKADGNRIADFLEVEMRRMEFTEMVSRLSAEQYDENARQFDETDRAGPLAGVLSDFARGGRTHVSATVAQLTELMSAPAVQGGRGDTAVAMRRENAAEIGAEDVSHENFESGTVAEVVHWVPVSIKALGANKCLITLKWHGPGEPEGAPTVEVLFDDILVEGTGSQAVGSIVKIEVPCAVPERFAIATLNGDRYVIRLYSKRVRPAQLEGSNVEKVHRSLVVGPWSNNPVDADNFVVRMAAGTSSETKAGHDVLGTIWINGEAFSLVADAEMQRFLVKPRLPYATVSLLGDKYELRSADDGSCTEVVGLKLGDVDEVLETYESRGASAYAT